jgi:hypothetical protein
MCPAHLKINVKAMKSTAAVNHTYFSTYKLSCFSLPCDNDKNNMAALLKKCTTQEEEQAYLLRRLCLGAENGNSFVRMAAEHSDNRMKHRDV